MNNKKCICLASGNSRIPLIVLMMLMSSNLFAQWIGYPSAGTPYKADGSVDMAAPAPRLTNGKPDLSGVWISDRTPDGEESPSNVYDLPTSRFMNNMGVDMSDGLPYQPWLIPLVKKRTDNLAIEDPHIRCLPDTFLRAYGLPHMLKFVHQPDLMLVLNEMNAGYRQVFIDGRALPDDPSPSWQGYSSANWEGDTLVIDSIGFHDDTWIDWNGSVLTETARVREEIRRPDFGHLLIKVTVDDPEAYTKPWSVELKQRVVVDGELIDEICIENERFVEHMDLEN